MGVVDQPVTDPISGPMILTLCFMFGPEFDNNDLRIIIFAHGLMKFCPQGLSPDWGKDVKTKTLRKLISLTYLILEQNEP